jgi:NADH-quinone oxidoreductase subunit A
MAALGQTMSGYLPVMAELFPLVVYTAMALLLVGGLLVAAWWLGEKRTGTDKGAAYESGILPSGSARLAYPVPFYLVAIFFIVFDVESVFIFIWAVAWDLLGIPGLVHITVFITVLLMGLLWLWRKGGLDWGPTKSSTFKVQGSEFTPDH